MPFEEWVVAHARVAKRPHKAAKLEDTLTFFHQLSTLVSSGTPLLQALKIASTQCESIKLRTILELITAKVAAGSTFHTAAAAYPHIFEFQWIEAIRTGEVTGKMAQVLVELNKQIRDSRETKRKVKASLMYPMILICVAVIAVTVMLWMVVPTFAKMFNDMGAKLPGDHPVRRRRLELHRRLRALCRHRRCHRQSWLQEVHEDRARPPLRRRHPHGPAHRRRADGPDGDVQVLLEPVPAAEERRADDGDDEHRQGNLPEQPALPRGPGAGQLAGRVGQGPYLSLQETGLFLPMLTNMVQVGEESGQLALVMEQIAPFYKEKMETMILKVTKMLEPIIIMFMGTSIAGLMLAIYMPMFEMAGNVK